MAIVRRTLSGSSFGGGILITGTAATALATVHQGPANTSSWDEVYVWASNHASATYCHIVTGFGSSGTNNYIHSFLAPRENKLILQGQTLLGSTSASDSWISVFSLSGGTSVSMFGYVNRIT